MTQSRSDYITDRACYGAGVRAYGISPLATAHASTSHTSHISIPYRTLTEMCESSYASAATYL